jgi:hypothetical protein
MFHAFVVVCAMSFNYEVDRSDCFRLDDAWGPYKTQDNCRIRSKQMVDDILYGELNETVFFLMGQPPSIQAEGYCEKVEGDEEA